MPYLHQLLEQVQVPVHASDPIERVRLARAAGVTVRADATAATFP